MASTMGAKMDEVLKRFASAATMQTEMAIQQKVGLGKGNQY